MGHASRLESRTFVDLYAGCGGLSLGLLSAGWQGLFAIEKDDLAFETLRHNLIDGGHEPRYAWPSWFPKKPIAIGPFTKRYREQLKLLRGSVTLIAGGPPCQGFSLAGRRKKNDPRNRLFRQYVEIVEIVRPPFLLMENVRGISVEFGKKHRGPGRRRGRPPTAFSQKIRTRLNDLGYEVYPKLLKAADHGVPQLRPRYILIAVARHLLTGRERYDPYAGLEAIRRAFLAERGLPLGRPVSVKEALSDLEIAGKEMTECVDSPGFRQIVYREPITDYQRLLHGSTNGTPPNSLRLARHRPDIRVAAQYVENCCKPL